MKHSLEMLANAYATLAKVKKNDAWWPHTQGERTVLAQAIALEWADRDEIGARSNETWVSTCWGRAVDLQREMFAHYNVKLPLDGSTYAARGNRRLSAFQFLVDFSIWPTDEAKTKKLVHLTMESEMYSQHNVEAEVHNGNGFVYDFFKVIWCPSPRRLFACCVIGEARRDKLQESLGLVAETNSAFIGSDDLRVFIFAPGAKHRDDTRVGVWLSDERSFAWQKVGPEEE